MDRISNVLNKRFAEKGDVANQFKVISHKIKEIKTKVAMNTSNTSDTEEAILTKRPVGNYCASCDKEMVNMRTDSVGYSTWDKFPVRDQSRIKAHMKSPRKADNDAVEEEAKAQDSTLPKLYAKQPVH